jgi:cytochrome b subunit of formate dehydrogenase
MARSELAREAIDREAGEYVVRFDLHQRVQHVLMFTSFIVLALTGYPQKFPDFAISRQFIALLGGLELTQLAHHVAAWVMIIDGVYHIAYLAYTVGIRRDLGVLRMVPSLKDLQDLRGAFLYFFGIRKGRPRFGRFAYLEKFDYWAVFWGMFIMGGSGLVLMYPVIVSGLAGGPVVPMALAAHSDEAVLAVAWIFIVHLFYAHLAPAVFPINTSIFTGKVSIERYREEHPLELEEQPLIAVAQAERVARQVVAEAADGVPTVQDLYGGRRNRGRRKSGEGGVRR